MSRYKYLLLLGLVGGLCLFAAPKVSASSMLPEQSDFGGAATRLLVGNAASNGTGIDSPLSSVKIYSLVPNISVVINGFDQCQNDGFDYLTPGTTNYQVYQTLPSETRSSLLTSVNNSTNCSPVTNTVTLNVTHTGSKSSKLGHENYYVFEFVAALTGVQDGFNGFTLQVPGQEIGYSATSGRDFSIKGQYNTNAPTYADYTLRFAPSCDTTSAVTRNLEWFDADQGQGNQLRQISFDVYDDTVGGSPIVATQTNLGGQGVASSLAVTLQPNHKYRWVWHNVSSYNGVQFQMPYDSIYYINDCASAVQISCGVLTAVPQYPEPNVAISLKAPITINNAPTSPPPTIDAVAYMSYSRSGAVGPPTVIPASATKTVSGATIAVLVSNTGTLSLAAGVYTANWSIKYNGADRPQPICSGNFEVTSLPYLSVTGGDAIAGSGIAVSAGSACPASTNSKAGFVSWNKNNAPYDGAGSQYAAFALNYIQAFATNQGLAAPTGLSFANQPFTPPGGGVSSIGSPDRYGGMFSNAPCIDYWAKKPSSIANTYVSGASIDNLSGVYQASGQITIPTATIAPGKRLTLYVTGDVKLPGNIMYANPNSWSTTADIPAFRLIVQGNIYVQDFVQKLDGLYAAVPSLNPDNTVVPTSGIIATCSNNFASYDFTNTSSISTLFSRCGHSLTFTGSVAANQVWPLRTYGSLSAGLGAAERFGYSPEVWLSADPNGRYSDKYDSIVGLPPVL